MTESVGANASKYVSVNTTVVLCWCGGLQSENSLRHASGFCTV